MKHISGLALVLVVFWLINSGHFEALLLGLGLLSIVGVMLINRRLEAVDGEYEPPVLMTLRLPGYLLWLLWQIVKSNIDVVRCIWQRSPQIRPAVLRITVSQQSDVVKVLHANSITMTPGTVTLEVEGNEFEVHALTRAAADGLKSGEMDRRVTSLEG